MKYAGAMARNYDRDRESSPKWQFEQRAVETTISRLGPVRTLLDVPVGTGRFLSFYRAHGIDAEGVDLSRDMIEIARMKVPSARLAVGDLFELRRDRKWDCVVCVRFLNWLTTSRLESAMSILSDLAHRWVVLSISTSKREAYEARSGARIFSALDFEQARSRAGLVIADAIEDDRGDYRSRIMVLSR